MSVKGVQSRFSSLIPYREKRKASRYNPVQTPDIKSEDVQPVYEVINYSSTAFDEQKFNNELSCANYAHDELNTWINVDGLNRKEIEQLCTHFNVHTLVTEDILSVGQRAKMDEIDNTVSCIIPTLYYNTKDNTLETCQISIVLGKDFLLSFQKNEQRDILEPIRQRLRNGNLKIRQQPVSYLCYAIIDLIVDSYFDTIEKITNDIEKLEDVLISGKDQNCLVQISFLRREVSLLRHIVFPVREMLNTFINSDSDLLDDSQDKYYKDVRDHIIQANDYVESQRDMLSTLQDLYLNQINLRMNEVMKVLTIAALLAAPATIISGIFGMNFEYMPFLHNHNGYYIAIAGMLVTTVLMILYFKWKKWL